METRLKSGRQFESDSAQKTRDAKRGLVWLAVKRSAVQKVAGTLRVPAFDSQEALLFEGCGRWIVPATLLR